VEWAPSGHQRRRRRARPAREGADAAHLARRRARAAGRLPLVAIRRRWRATPGRIAGAGFRLTRALAIDLMPQTFHVEVLATFDRIAAQQA